MPRLRLRGMPKTDAIFSIRPHFAASILEGEKTVELRKVAPKHLIDRIWIYSTHPVQRIVGHFRPSPAHPATAEDYLRAMVPPDPDKSMYAIGIYEATTLEPPITPREMGLPYLWLAPQSWRYCGEKEKARLREMAP